MTNKFLSRSVASLTNDDTKILGNIKPKLKKLEEQYNLQTNKFKTLNSSWTPLVNRTANKTVFEERVDLASHWFDLWNDKQRKWFLLNLFSRLRPPQICYMEDLFESFGIYERRDFTRTLPTNLSKHIFSFLSPQDLAKCAQVSSHWKHLSEHDDVWRPKALKFGWYLPYEPFHREHGAWKAHYIECVCGINALPLSKEDAYKYREVLYKRELTDVEKENFLYFQNKRDLQDWEKYEINCARKPWQHSSTKPRDLKKTDRLLYSHQINNNQPTEENLLNSVYKTRFGLPVESKKPHLRELMKSRSITGYMLDDLRQSLPLHVLNIKDAYKSMRKSEADFFSTKLSSASMRSFKDYPKNLETEKINTISLGFSLSKNQVAFLDENPHVIFISSKVSCCHMLLEALKIDTVAIPYDFESMNIDSLSKLLQQALKGRLAKSIGFFLHFEKPGQVALTQDKSIYKVNITNNDISNFFMQIKDQACVEKNAKLDFFVPLGSSVDGIELVDKLQSFIGLDIRVPTGYLGNYKFVKSKWINSGPNNSNPSLEYFVESKLDIWLNYCEILNDAHDKINNTVLKGFNNEIDQIVMKRIVGKLVFDALSNTKFLSDLKTQQELSNLIIRTAKVKSDNFFRILSTELTNDLIQSFQEEPLNDNNNVTDRLESSNGDDILKSSLNFSSNNVMRSDAAFRSFLRNKSVSEDLEPGLRIQISLELAESEISYLKQLEIIQKYYARPVKASLDAGRKIVAQSIIDLLFNDLAILYNLSKEIVREFNLRIKNWKVDCCIADVLNTLSSNIQCYINYANNYDTIISTIDKLINSNPKFRSFLLNANKAAGGLTLQSLLQSPWTRVKEYMNLLGSLQLHTPQNHPDHANITNNIKRIREIYLFIKQLQDRLNNKHEMIEIQRTILDSPKIITDGRYLVLRQNATLLNKRTYAFVKDLTCFLFNDGLLLAYRIKKHFPFTKFTEETLIYYELIDDLLNMTISDISDYRHAVNVVNLQFNKYDDFFISFETYEAKHNFLKSLKLASELAVSTS